MVGHPFIWQQVNGHLDIVKALLAMESVDVNVQRRRMVRHLALGMAI
jgi:hypothetical protein